MVEWLFFNIFYVVDFFIVSISEAWSIKSVAKVASCTIINNETTRSIATGTTASYNLILNIESVVVVSVLVISVDEVFLSILVVVIKCEDGRVGVV